MLSETDDFVDADICIFVRCETIKSSSFVFIIVAYNRTHAVKALTFSCDCKGLPSPVVRFYAVLLLLSIIVIAAIFRYAGDKEIVSRKVLRG